MTAEKFHDALTLLPADLVAEADKIRSGKPRIIPFPWKPYIAAACLALVLLGGSLTRLQALPGISEQAAYEEAAMLQGSANAAFDAAAPAAEAAPAEAEEGQLRTESILEGAPASGSSNTSITAASPQLHPGIALLETLEAASDQSAACYSSEPKPKLFRSRAELETYAENSIRFQQDNLLETCASYDEGWFETHDLLLLTACRIPAGLVPEISDIRHSESQWKFVIHAGSTDETELRDWHFLLSVEKDLISPEDRIIKVTNPQPGT